MNLCIDCKYIGTNGAQDFSKYRCFAPENEAGVNYITGNKTYKLQLCIEIRYPILDVATHKLSEVVDCVMFEQKPHMIPAPHSLQPASFSGKLKKVIGMEDL